MIRTIWASFTRGHRQITSVFVWSLTTSVILYGILGDYVPWIRSIDYLAFLILFGASYFILTTVIGYLDYSRGSWIEQGRMEFVNNPEWKEMRDDVTLILRVLAQVANMKEMMNDDSRDSTVE